MSEPNMRLLDLATSETGFVFDPSSGATFSTNAVGLVILDCLKSSQKRCEIVKSLRDAFDVSEGEDDLSRDIDEFLQLLKRHQIVEKDFRLE